eukprot:m.323226 g.323226  ORF g.323226 m.323226 type:complete len:84 (-) comp55521_c0_seq14:751-1002(-)
MWAWKNGYTALLHAAEAGRIDIYQALLRAGADPTIKTESGWTMLHAAAQADDTDLLLLLLQAGIFEIDAQDTVRRLIHFSLVA